jgi:hypothetical protein
MVRKGHIPPPVSAVEIEIDGEVYYDIAPTMSGSAAVVSYTPRSLHAARILVERNRAEMHALGFADGGVGGADRFQIAAGHNLRLACCDAGTLRVGRADCSDKHSCGVGENTQTTPFVPIRGVWVWESITLDGHGASTMAEQLRAVRRGEPDAQLCGFQHGGFAIQAGTSPAFGRRILCVRGGGRTVG